jgi:hypothetical protein
MIGRAPTEPAGQQRPGHDVPVAGRLDRQSRWTQVRGRYDPKLPRASDGAHGGDWLFPTSSSNCLSGKLDGFTLRGDALGAVSKYSDAGIVRSS